MLFICHTAYHVFVSCCKVMLDHCSASIIITDNIPGVEKLASRLTQSQLFSSVRIVYHSEILPRFTRKSFHLSFIAMCFFIEKATHVLKECLSNEIYIFNDYSNIGAFLILKKIPYHLLEDGCNTYSRDVHVANGRCKFAKKILYLLFKIPYSLGMNKNCIDIEVNDQSIVKTTFLFPIIEKNRKQITNSLNEHQKEVLNDIFAININCQNKKKKLLLLTQPLVEMRLKKNNNEVLRYYSSVLSKYYDEYEIYIKPHPRDDTNYSDILNENVVIIDRTIPSEVLTLSNRYKFDKALISSSSTSYYSIKDICVEIEMV